MDIYTKDHSYQHMHIREFVFMQIDYVSKTFAYEGCENCLMNTRKKVQEFFQKADCTESGQITSEQFYMFLKEINKNYPLTH